MARPMPLAGRDQGTPHRALRTRLERRLSGLKTERTSVVSQWREISEYLLPTRGKYLPSPNDPGRGKRKDVRIIDSTAQQALQHLAAGVMGGITSPSRPWFKLTVHDQSLADSEPIKIWLDEVARRMLHLFATSNFYQSLAVIYLELAAFGTGSMLIMEDHEDGITCHPMTVGEYFLGQDAAGRVDALYREFVMTASQALEKFGAEGVSETVKNFCHNGRGDQEIVICHAIQKPPVGVELPPLLRKLPYIGAYWEAGNQDKVFMELRGFHEFPVCAPRWITVGNEVYGTGPGMNAIGDVRQLQLMQLRADQALDKMVNPPLVGPMQLKNEPWSTVPGGMTFLDGIAQAGMRPLYEVRAPFAEMLERIREVQGRIKSVFFEDLFLMVSQLDTVRTATEISERRNEKLLMLGPVLENLQKELLKPAIDRTFDIMRRMGLLPKPPAQLGGQELQIEYVSILAETQRAVGTTGLERMAGYVGNLAGVFPQVLDKIDPDALITTYNDMLGNTPKLIVDDAKVEEIRKARAKQIQNQQNMQNSMAAVQGAKLLSETETGAGQNALQSMMGL
ncbi:MAG: phage tail protein [Magnetococcales bacterium]|nr:phage tail protein [Magnetococcales bacterium]